MNHRGTEPQRKPNVKTRRLSLWLCASVVIAIGVLPFNMASQTPATPVQPGTREGQFTLKTSTEIVLVNVVVKDRDDKLVKDLRTEDFTVLEEGKKQDIVSIDIENTDAI